MFSGDWLSDADGIESGMEVRDANSRDAEAICVLLRRSILELCELDHAGDPALLQAWLLNKTPENVASWIRRADSSMLTACEGDRLAAVGAVTDCGEILLNYVSPDFRFLGASHALLAAMERRAAERGASRCTLMSTKTARRFYLARGYQPAAAAAVTADGLSCLAMSRTLTSPDRKEAAAAP